MALCVARDAGLMLSYTERGTGKSSSNPKNTLLKVRGFLTLTLKNTLLKVRGFMRVAMPTVAMRVPMRDVIVLRTRL